MAAEPAYMRWIPAEWQVVAAHALRHLDRGLPLADALLKAQKALPKERQRDEAEVNKLCWAKSSAHRYIAQARELPKEALEALAPPPAPRKPPAPRVKLDEGRDYSTPGQAVRWTTLEKARVAKQVKQWQDAGDERVLSRLIIEAQELVLSVDRRRPVASIGAGVGKYNDLMMADGLANQWLLKEEEAQAAATSEPELQETAQEPVQLASPPPYGDPESAPLRGRQGLWRHRHVGAGRAAARAHRGATARG